MAAMGLLLLVVLPGCGVGSDSPGARWQQQVKENESPKQGIDFIWTVHDAPGPFEKVVGRAQYDVINSGECGYVQPATGTPTGMTTSMEVPLEKISDVEYRGTVFQDLLKNGNYYGRAECRWGLTAVAVVFRATGAADETRFDTLMNREPLIAGGRVVKFYLGKNYPRVESYPGYPSFGKTEVNQYNPAFRHGAFSASIKSQGDKN